MGSQSYITAGQKQLLNTMNRAAGKVLLGTKVEDLADDLEYVRERVADSYTYETFPSIATQAKGGGAASGTTGATNNLVTPNSIFEYHVKGAGQTIASPVQDTDGLDISGDLTSTEGMEYTQGITAGAKHAYTAGTDAFFIEAKVKAADVSGVAELAVGFRKAEAYQAAIDNYDEGAFINMQAGTINIETILNNAATTTTDSTKTLADGETLTFRVENDPAVGLERAIALALECKSDYNTHLASLTAHTAADTTNVVVAADPTTLATLITLVTELLTDYDAHEGDSEQASAWSYHEAQEAGNCSLASTSAPTDIATCIARLNDFRAKFNTHGADGTSHVAAETGDALITTRKASSVTFKVLAHGDTAVAEIPAAAASTSAFTFDNAEVVVPFLFFLHDATTPGEIDLVSWEVGSL